MQQILKLDMFLEHYHKLGLTSGEAMVLVHLDRVLRKENDIEILITAGTLAERMGVTATAVRDNIRKLRERG